jgi:hypothetical protein
MAFFASSEKIQFRSQEGSGSWKWRTCRVLSGMPTTRNQHPGQLAYSARSVWTSAVHFCKNRLTLTCRWLYRRSVVVDGNFKAEQMRMRRPEQDVILMDGHGFFVQDGPYQEHLRTARQYKQVTLYESLLNPSRHSTCVLGQKPTCSNHKAGNESVSGQKNLAVTGVGAAACARHGCFIPHAMVDFQKGERSDLPLLILTWTTYKVLQAG